MVGQPDVQLCSPCARDSLAERLGLVDVVTLGGLAVPLRSAAPEVFAGAYWLAGERWAQLGEDEEIVA